MTNGEQLAKAFPKQIARIRQLADDKFLAQEPDTSAPNTLAAAFDWFSTAEGWEFWNDLYQFGPPRAVG